MKNQDSRYMYITHISAEVRMKCSLLRLAPSKAVLLSAQANFAWRKLQVNLSVQLLFCLHVANVSCWVLYWAWKWVKLLKFSICCAFNGIPLCKLVDLPIYLLALSLSLFLLLPAVVAHELQSISFSLLHFHGASISCCCILIAFWQNKFANFKLKTYFNNSNKSEWEKCF